MNELLFRILEHNKFIFMAFAIIGTISFFLYSFRGDDLESNSFRYVIPVSLWLLAENIGKSVGYTFPEKWNKIAVIASCALIIIMIIISLKKDFSFYAIFNIWGNLFVMYAVPSVIYIIIASLVAFGGGAVLIILGVPILALGAMLAEERIYD